MKLFVLFFLSMIVVFPVVAVDKYLENPPIEQLSIKGENFINAKGNIVRFWGVNVVALYPEHKTAEALAENIASFGFNLVRPHHMMRNSLDWNLKSKIGALVDYSKGNTYTFDKNALDRFDYLNAQLRRRGIYLALALRWSRQYKPEDADILQTTPDDRKAWMDSMDELNKWHWQKSHDVRKMLPMVDERVFEIERTFAKKLLTHVNPYTGMPYGKDPQVLMLEVINEFSSEYALICGNRFPEYWNKKLQAKWKAFLSQKGGGDCDLYKPQTELQKQIRSDFFRKLDEDYYRSMKKLLAEIGCKTPTTFSNLWRGERDAKMHAELSDVVENHSYSNPFIVESGNDLILSLSRKALVNKPYFIGELNQAEGQKNVRRQSRYRTMLPLAVSTYGGLHSWSGIEWFAWQHGDRILGSDGLPEESAVSRDQGKIGELMSDDMMLDHMKTCGIIFRKKMADPSILPITVIVDEPMSADSYDKLMKPKYDVSAGWQDIHSIRRTYGASVEVDREKPWFKSSPSVPLVSDTGEITKDLDRRQFVFCSRQAEAFSGWLDGKERSELKHLEIIGNGTFATVVLVALDNMPLNQSKHLLISRTAINSENQEISVIPVGISGLINGNWQVRITRPESTRKLLSDYAKVNFVSSAIKEGMLQMPLLNWHECELILR